MFPRERRHRGTPSAASRGRDEVRMSPTTTTRETSSRRVTPEQKQELMAWPDSGRFLSARARSVKAFAACRSIVLRPAHSALRPRRRGRHDGPRILVVDDTPRMLRFQVPELSDLPVSFIFAYGRNETVCGCSSRTPPTTSRSRSPRQRGAGYRSARPAAGSAAAAPPRRSHLPRSSAPGALLGQ